jgi:hypothetical protein
MSTFVDCPSCGRPLRVTDDLSGGRLRCPACDSSFDSTPAASETNSETAADTAAAGPTPGTPWSVTPSARPAPAPPPPPPSDVAPGDSDERDEREGDEDERPWEERYDEPEVRRDCEPHRGNVVLILGIMSLVLFWAPLVGLILGIVVTLMGRTDMKKIEDGQMDPQGKGTTLAGWICGIIGTIFGALATLYLLFAIVVWGILVFAMVRAMPAPPPRPAPMPAPAPPKAARLDVRDGVPRAARDYLPHGRGCASPDSGRC